MGFSLPDRVFAVSPRGTGSASGPADERAFSVVAADARPVMQAFAGLLAEPARSCGKQR